MKVLAVLAIVAAVAVSATRVALEEGTRVPEAYIKGDRAHPAHPVTLTFAVKHRNQDKIESTLMSVSDPRSPDYGKHLSLDDIAAKFGNPEGVATVLAYLESNGLSGADVTLTNDFVVLETHAKAAEALLDIELYHYQHSSESWLSVVRCDKPYTVPAELASVLDFVGGVSHFQQPSRMRVEAPGAGLVVDPHLLRSRYAVGDTEGGKASNNSMAVAQFLGQYMSELDLDEFRTLFSPESFGVTPTIVGPNHLPPGTEASLDIEYVMAMGAKIDTTFWSTGNLTNGQEPFLQWMLDVGNDTNPPLLFSVSYGDDESSLSVSFMTRVSDQLALQGMRGISIMFASGDSGVGCNSDGTFEPNFPATSPHVTSVGGTALHILETGNETVNGLSTGGFSNVFDQPSYQSEAVATYLSTSGQLPPAKFYNASGRGVPDVSALSSGFIIVLDLIPVPGIAGTSCASPTFSGIVALLNDLRLAAGKAPLGFLNPFIYQTLASSDYSSAFFDVTEGGNPNQFPGKCGSNCFFAAPGWDPASGVGTPLYSGLAEAIGNLP